MRIGVDLDGCVYDFVGDFRTWVHAHTGKPLDVMPDAETWNFFADQWGLTLAEYLDLLAVGVRRGEVFRNGNPIPGALKHLRNLARLGHELHIVTNRPQDGARENTLHWLALWRVPFTSLTFAADKTCVPVDVFIEDNVDNATALEAAGTPAIVFDQAWNRHYTGSTRCHTWAGVEEFCQLLDVDATETVLEEADRIVAGDRRDDYGHPYHDFTRTGRMWGALLDDWRSSDVEGVPAQLVGLCMVALKMSREVNRPKRDNRVDGAGYLKCVDLIETYEPEVIGG